MTIKNLFENISSDNPIKVYRALDNFRLDEFYEISDILTKSIYNKRDDIDLPGHKSLESFDPIEFSNRVIREYTPWEHAYIFSQKEALIQSNELSYIKSKSKLKTLNGLSKKDSSSNKNLFGWIIAILIASIIKMKALFLLIFTKIGSLFHFLAYTLKLKGFLMTAGSMIISIFAYALAFKFEVALGLVFLIFIHEMGHALIISLRGMSTGLPVFIPFMGAFISLKQAPKNALMEAQIALGGPLFGTLASYIMYLGFIQTNQFYFLYLAYIGFMMNLFNLTPVRPLDGGRIVTAISKKIWLVGITILLLLTIWLHTPVLILVLFFAITNLIHREENTEDHDYYNVSPLIKASFSIIYFGLVIFLGFASYETYNLLLENKENFIQ